MRVFVLWAVSLLLGAVLGSWGCGLGIDYLSTNGLSTEYPWVLAKGQGVPVAGALCWMIHKQTWQKQKQKTTSQRRHEKSLKTDGQPGRGEVATLRAPNPAPGSQIPGSSLRIPLDREGHYRVYCPKLYSNMA